MDKFALTVQIVKVSIVIYRYVGKSVLTVVQVGIGIVVGKSAFTVQFVQVSIEVLYLPSLYSFYNLAFPFFIHSWYSTK
jgi:hypothetical protein